ncbi:ABC transporter ATP-binding protein [candidate division TA06 bacterium]|nr:ABC transporter ATP-binding protein [candidate division TA06 bacterium]
MNLIISNLTKKYSNGVTALNNVSVEIPTGMFGLLGPNGAGKTTLMRTIATLQEPDTGQVYFGEIDVLKEKMEVKKTLGYLPQTFDFYPKETAESMLDHFILLKGIKAKKARRGKVDELLKRVNLWEQRKQKLGTFSGGMKQRFGIALVLLGNPQLIIVDEPTAGLDPAERVRFHNLLSEIGQDKVVILSTHIVDDVSDLCPSLAIIDKGRIVLQARTLDAIAALEGKVWEKEIPKSEIPEYQNKYDLLSSRLFAGRTLIRIHNAGDPGDGFIPQPAGLEDVYFHTLKR